MTNEQLVAEIKAGRNERDNMAVLWEQNRAFVAQKARKYLGYAEYDDLMQEGFIAMHDAVERYEPERGVLFLTLAGMRIDAAMTRCARNQNMIRIPACESDLIKKYCKITNGIRSRTGREPTVDEIKAEMCVSDKIIDRIERNMCIRQMASLESAVESNIGEDIPLLDTIADDNNSIEELEDSIFQKALKETIWKTVDNLPTDQRSVIHERYSQWKSCGEIAEESGMSYNKVWSIENNALRSMRSGKHSKELLRFLDVQIYIAALKQSGYGSFKLTHTSSTERIAIGMM